MSKLEDFGPTSRSSLETMAREVVALRPRVASLEQANRALRGDAAAAPASPPAPSDVANLSDEDLKAFALEVFELRRRIVELEAENRELKMKFASEAGVEPPVPATPATGFAFGIADATGTREVVVERDIVKLGKDSMNHVILAGARMMHAVIERTPKGVTIIDMGTKEGTLVNGAPITKTTLQSGDRLGIADAQVIVVFATAS